VKLSRPSRRGCRSSKGDALVPPVLGPACPPLPLLAIGESVAGNRSCLVRTPNPSRLPVQSCPIRLFILDVAYIMKQVSKKRGLAGVERERRTAGDPGKTGGGPGTRVRP